MLHQQYSTTTTTDNDHITLEIIDISIQYDDNQKSVKLVTPKMKYLFYSIRIMICHINFLINDHLTTLE